MVVALGEGTQEGSDCGRTDAAAEEGVTCSRVAGEEDQGGSGGCRGGLHLCSNNL